MAKPLTPIQNMKEGWNFGVENKREHYYYFIYDKKTDIPFKVVDQRESIEKKRLFQPILPGYIVLGDEQITPDRKRYFTEQLAAQTQGKLSGKTLIFHNFVLAWDLRGNYRPQKLTDFATYRQLDSIPYDFDSTHKKQVEDWMVDTYVKISIDQHIYTCHGRTGKYFKNLKRDEYTPWYRPVILPYIGSIAKLSMDGCVENVAEKINRDFPQEAKDHPALRAPLRGRGITARCFAGWRCGQKLSPVPTFVGLRPSAQPTGQERARIVGWAVCVGSVPAGETCNLHAATAVQSWPEAQQTLQIEENLHVFLDLRPDLHSPPREGNNRSLL